MISCINCKIRPATYHIHDMERKQRTLHLCEECRKDFSLIGLFCDSLDKVRTHPTRNYLPSLIQESKLDSTFLENSSIKKILDDNIRCPRCSNSANNIIMKGIVGCTEDIMLFNDVIKKVLTETQGASQHYGKKYIQNEEQKHTSKIISLEFKLKKAIQEERYELASEISKEINALKTL